jgi:hypothetical protein
MAGGEARAQRADAAGADDAEADLARAGGLGDGIGHLLLSVSCGRTRRATVAACIPIVGAPAPQSYGVPTEAIKNGIRRNTSDLIHILRAKARPVPAEPEHAFDSFVGACSCRRTGITSPEHALIDVAA